MPTFLYTIEYVANIFSYPQNTFDLAPGIFRRMINNYNVFNILLFVIVNVH